VSSVISAVKKSIVRRQAFRALTPVFVLCAGGVPSELLVAAIPTQYNSVSPCPYLLRPVLATLRPKRVATGTNTLYGTVHDVVHCAAVP
jgi:hypothetical protein